MSTPTRCVAVVVGNPKPRSRTLAAAVHLARELNDGAEPDLVVDLADLDRFSSDGLRGIAVPLMLGAGPGHALAPELTLRPVLTEIGASVPVRGLYVLDATYDDPTVYTHWLDRARPAITALLGNLAGRTGVTS